MVTAIFFITTVFCAAGWLANKIGILTILLYFAEHGAKMPESEEIKEYREKVIRKHFKIN